MANLASLYQHYQLHKAEAAASGKAISVADFFLLHYAASTTHQHPCAPQSHQDLPLKSLHDVQWVEGKPLALSFSNPDPVLSCPSGSVEDLLSEGIRRLLFRPPLAA